MSNNPKREQIAKPITARLLGISGDDRKFLIVSVVLHVIVFSALLVSWNFNEPVQNVSLPANIQAHLLNPDELKMRRPKQPADVPKEVPKEDDLKEAKELKELEKKAELERKNMEQKKQEEAKRKEDDARKKALIKKQEQEKKAKEEQTKAEQQRQKELEKKKSEELEKEKLRKLQEKDKLQAEREKRLMERMKAAEASENKLDTERLSQAQQAASQQELTEIERFTNSIRLKVEQQWHKPPNSTGRRVVVRINLLPTGEMSSVVVLESSGNDAFDQSVLSAVRSVRLYPVPENSKVFEKNFRQLSLAFIGQ